MLFLAEGYFLLQENINALSEALPANYLLSVQLGHSLLSKQLLPFCNYFTSKNVLIAFRSLKRDKLIFTLPLRPLFSKTKEEPRTRSGTGGL